MGKAKVEPQKVRGGKPFGLRERLEQLDVPVRVAIAGAGAMGRGLLYQCAITPGFECVGVADIDVEKAINCAESLSHDFCLVDTDHALVDAYTKGKLPVCESAALLAEAAQADVFIDATSAIRSAALFCVKALDSGMHLVMMNAEADLAFGPYLAERAQANGVTYASCDGDQHGVIKRLYDDITLWGFEPVMAGNIKGYLDRAANPTNIIPEADKRNLDYKMCTAYTDGTKLNIEMALLANALDLDVLEAGMQGPSTDQVGKVLSLYDFNAIRSYSRPVVDYILGAEPGGGVFVVGYCDEAYQQEMMAYYKMGKGPYYVFYRPYHLCHVEALEAIAVAYLEGRALLKPDYGRRADVYAYAKQDLTKGDRLDGIGGYACYGLIERCEEQAEAPGVPMVLADDLYLKRSVAKDEKILLSDVDYDPGRTDFQIYHRPKEATKEGPVPA